MPLPYISIIIPVHNGSSTIEPCLRSVYRSDYSDFECIVVDDHSTDNTPDKVAAFDAKYIRLDQQSGAAHARNQGAYTAQGDILLFIDADVEIYPDSMDKVVKAFKQYPDVSAVFGSYDDQPAHSNFLSQYKNLFHHFVHQTSKEEGTTFFTACGAIKKEVFFEVGKFNETCRMMEDIELGYRLKASNQNIRLVKNLFVKHLKRYSFLKLLKSDFLDRAIPWTVLMLRHQHHTTDLNLKPTQKLSALAVMGLFLAFLLSFGFLWVLWFVPVLLAAFFGMNFSFYHFFLRKRGVIFMLKVVPFHMLYYVYSSLGFVIGLCRYRFSG